MSDTDVTWIDSTPLTPEGWQELDTHVHVRGSGHCVKHEDGPLCENDPEALRTALDELATWATQSWINLDQILAGGGFPEGAETIRRFLEQAPEDVRLAARTTLDQDPPPAARRCSTCAGSGWFGARRHDPEHYASHLHCPVCEAPCKACAAGDGFRR